MDSGYPQMCSEYARDIFKYLREMEVSSYILLSNLKRSKSYMLEFFLNS